MLGFINKHFVLVTKSEAFMNLSVDEVIEWISSDDVEIKAEDEIFEVVINWVEHSPDSRKNCLLSLLRHVRLTLVTPKYLHSKILKSGLIKGNEVCMELVLKSISMEDLSNQQDGSFCETPRKCLETHVHCLFVCGGGERISGSDACCCFVPDEGRWYSLENMITKRSCHAVSSCRGLVYSLGGLVSNNMVERFDPTINSWVKVAPLSIARMVFHSVASLNGLCMCAVDLLILQIQKQCTSIQRMCLLTIQRLTPGRSVQQRYMAG